MRLQYSLFHPGWNGEGAPFIKSKFIILQMFNYFIQLLFLEFDFIFEVPFLLMVQLMYANQFPQQAKNLTDESSKGALPRVFAFCFFRHQNCIRYSINMPRNIPLTYASQDTCWSMHIIFTRCVRFGLLAQLQDWVSDKSVSIIATDAFNFIEFYCCDVRINLIFSDIVY